MSGNYCCRSGRWRHYLGPCMVGAYCVFVVVVIPVCVAEMVTQTQQTLSRRVGWFVAGMLVVITLPISVWDIGFHLYHYTNPPLQRHIIRILWMVPVYGICSWIGLRVDSARVYMASLVSLYEAFVVYSFMCYLTSYLSMEYDMISVLMDKPQTKHMVPFCCCPNWKMGREFWQLCRFGVYQYTALNVIVTVVALSCEFAGKYKEGHFSGSNPWLYLCITTNISQIWALYCLVLFYKATREELQPIKPFFKFLCIKAVVFFSFWQSVFLAIVQAVGGLDAISPDKSKDTTCGSDCGWDSYQIQEFLICAEMFIAAIAHHFAFSYKPFIDEAASRPSYCESFWSMFDVRDIHQETLEHAGDAKIKLAAYSKRFRRQGPAEEESGETIPLLELGNGSAVDQDRHTNVSTSQPIDIQQLGDGKRVSSVTGGDGSEDVETQRDEAATGDHQKRKYYARASFEASTEILSVKDSTGVLSGRDSVEGKHVTDTKL